VTTNSIARPILQHFGLATTNLEGMTAWYREVTGMEVNATAAIPRGKDLAPVRAAFTSNDGEHQRMALFEIPGLTVDPDRDHHVHLQHVAFHFRTLDDLLDSYTRLKGRGIEPVSALDEGPHVAFYYRDPDGNPVELNANTVHDDSKDVEYFRNQGGRGGRPAPVDPNKLVAARNAGASPQELHERAVNGEFQPQTFRPPAF
jgi:catechol 2,3-dioxygenase